MAASLQEVSATATTLTTTTTTTTTTTITPSQTSTTSTTAPATTTGAGSSTTLAAPTSSTTTVPGSSKPPGSAFVESCAAGTADCAEFVTAGARGRSYTQAEYSVNSGSSWEVGSLPNIVYMAQIYAAMSCVANGPQVDCAVTYATWGPTSPIGEGGYYSTNGGATWAISSVPTLGDFSENWFAQTACFEVAGTVDCLAIDTVRGGMFYSTDGGAKWLVSARPAAPFVGSITFPGSTFACAVVGASLDCALAGGAVPSPFSVQLPLPSDFGKVSAYYSTNGGRSWAKSSLKRRTGEVEFVACAAVAGRPYCAGLGTQGGAAGAIVPLLGIYTTNGGSSWANSTFQGHVQVNEKNNPWGVASLTCVPGKVALDCQATISLSKAGKTLTVTIGSSNGGKSWSL